MTAQLLETVVLPRVSGRHRDRALASARKCRAIQLKLQGLTYQQIADELGYTSRGTVYKIVKTAQAIQLTGAVEEHLDIEVSRLNALQAAVWPAAISGDLRALVVAARIIEARCRLLGLIGPATKRTTLPTAADARPTRRRLPSARLPGPHLIGVRPFDSGVH